MIRRPPPMTVATLLSHRESQALGRYVGGKAIADDHAIVAAIRARFGTENERPPRPQRRPRKTVGAQKLAASD